MYFTRYSSTSSVILHSVSMFNPYLRGVYLVVLSLYQSRLYLRRHRLAGLRSRQPRFRHPIAHPRPHYPRNESHDKGEKIRLLRREH
jgi:hypothetical protein